MNALRAITVIIAGLGLAGCGVERLLGGMAQNYEYSKLIEVHPAYNGLENMKVAVLVDVDMSTLFQFPDVALTIGTNVSNRLRDNVPGIKVLSAALVSEWQFRTPQWSAMPYGEVCERLDVDRLVRIDVQEYRLHPPGNNWLWDGVCTATVGIVEREGFDPDGFADMFTVAVAYPDMQGVTRESADAARIQMGLLSLFVRDTAWLLFRHLEPKHPDKYRGPIEEGRYDGDD